MTEDAKIQATAKVVVTLETDIIGGGTWGPGCTVQQVHKQALDGLHNRLAAIVDQGARGVRIIGAPKVLMITHPTDGR